MSGDVPGLLQGRYTRDTLLATGGTGEVWQGRDLVLHRPVAVKVLSDPGDTAARAQLRAEARHAAALSHPGLAAVYDSGEGESDGAGDGAAWLVMELVEGEPLSQVLARGPLDVDTTLDVVEQTALALQAAHQQGVVHRDVKPGNLLVRPDGVVKVTDLGIAAKTGRAQPGHVVGTAYYLSPEQARGGAVTGASDLYSLGVVAYECLTGRRPFAGDDAATVAAAHLDQPAPPLPEQVPERVRDLVASCLAKDPAARPASAADLARDAAAVRASLAGRPRSSYRSDPPRQRHSRAATLAAALLAVVALGLGARACLADGGARAPDRPPGAPGSPR